MPKQLAKMEHFGHFQLGRVAQIPCWDQISERNKVGKIEFQCILRHVWILQLRFSGIEGRFAFDFLLHCFCGCCAIAQGMILRFFDQNSKGSQYQIFRGKTSEINGKIYGRPRYAKSERCDRRCCTIYQEKLILLLFVYVLFSVEKFHQKLLFDIDFSSLIIFPIVTWRKLVSKISVMLFDLNLEGIWGWFWVCSGDLWKSISHSIPTYNVPFLPSESSFAIGRDQRSSN